VADFGKALKDAFTSVQFGNEELNSKLADALSKFEAKAKDATAFSNRTAVQNFGVSSLAAVGGGGGVGRGGLLDEAARQTRLQENIGGRPQNHRIENTAAATGNAALQLPASA
jgi:hypothetical protein